MTNEKEDSNEIACRTSLMTEPREPYDREDVGQT